MTTPPDLDTDAGPLSGRRIVLGVTGGIAAYKAVEVCRRLVDAGAHVAPVMTDAAQKMVGATTFSALASEPVRTQLWDDPETPIPHTKLGQAADLILVCPATARLLSDLRTGRAADLLMATILASRAPVMVCPAMHTEMWEQASVRDNLATLVDRGVLVVEPEAGRLAGGDVGHGRLAEPATVVDAVIAALSSDSMAGRRVVVTAGGTREPIDSVRFIGNRSSGKQGHAIAAEAHARGADVVLVTTQPDSAPSGMTVISVDTAAEMAQACNDYGPGSDLVVMAAAVADFRPVTPVESKLKKADGIPSVELAVTDDILAALGARKAEGQILCGFAAETDDLLAHATAKLNAKNLDIIVANDVSQAGVGFDHDTNAVVVLTSDGDRHDVTLRSKRAVARAVLDVVAERWTPTSDLENS